MSVIYIVLPVALVLAAFGVAAFLWAVRRGQYDDLDTPPYRALFDDDDVTCNSNAARGNADEKN